MYTIIIKNKDTFNSIDNIFKCGEKKLSCCCIKLNPQFNFTILRLLMKALGIQHIAEFISCDNLQLNNPEALEIILGDAITKSGLHFVKIISHRFAPVGVTVLAIISESHIALHTYPEAGQISLDIFTCSDSRKQLALLEYLKGYFKPEVVKIAAIQRGNPIEMVDSNRITSASSHGFETKYIVSEILFREKSGYQEIEIIINPVFGKMLFIDKELQIADSDAEIYNTALLERVLRKNPGNCLILGGGDGSALSALMKSNPAHVTLVDIDKEVVDVSRKYFPEFWVHFAGEKSKILNRDAADFLAGAEQFDVIICDLTMHPEAFTRETREQYLARLFDGIYKSLSPGGIVTMQCGSLFDNRSITMAKELLANRFTGIEINEVYIPSFCEKWVFASGKKE